MKGRLLLALVLALGTPACSQAPTAPPAKKPEAKAPAATAMGPAAREVETGPAPQINATRAMQYVREIVSFGPRPVGSPGHRKVEAYLLSHLKGDQVETDEFTASTPAGTFTMRNYIARYPGSKDSVIVVATHYDTLYPQKNFVGANDGGSEQQDRNKKKTEEQGFHDVQGWAAGVVMVVDFLSMSPKKSSSALSTFTLISTVAWTSMGSSLR